MDTISLDDIQDTYGDRMRRVQRAIGADQKQMAELLGLGNSRYSHLVLNKASLKPEELDAIDATLAARGVPAGWLLGTVDPASPAVAGPPEPRLPVECAALIEKVESAQRAIERVAEEARRLAEGTFIVGSPAVREALQDALPPRGPINYPLTDDELPLFQEPVVPMPSGLLIQEAVASVALDGETHVIEEPVVSSGPVVLPAEPIPDDEPTIDVTAFENYLRAATPADPLGNLLQAAGIV